MNDAEALRHAMRADDGQDFRPVDVERVMRLGARMRTRRRLAVAGGALAVVAAVLIGVGNLGLGGTGTDPAQPVLITVGQPADPAAARDGDVIPTGVHTGGGEYVLYFVSGYVEYNRQSQPLPGSGYGLTLGYRGHDGVISPVTTTGSIDLKQGFHSVTLGVVPLFGFYSGPATRVVVTSGGRTAAAHIAKWSSNPGIVVFWFTPDQGITNKPKADFDITAYDSHGHALRY